ncbi:MAG: metallophosphoesterase, partial [Desulfobacterales bacterium]|nr:metallophosphoesterase [Desulfobacterales bacterium]
PARARLLAGVSLWMLVASARLLGHDRTGWLWNTLELVGMCWMGVLFLLFYCLIEAELVTCFGWLISRGAAKWAPGVRGAALLIGVALSLAALVQGARPPAVERYEVRIDELSDEMNGLKIAAASDMHIGAALDERWLSDRVDQILAMKPDMVVLLGDIVDGHGRPLHLIRPQLARLSAPLGVFAVLGNHEFHGGGSAGLELFQSAGIAVLRDRWTEVRPGLTLAGVDDPRAERWIEKNHDPLERALANHPSGALILLSHRPRDEEKAAAGGVDLMLCGHTHGGQIWPFDYLARLFHPRVEGRYQVEDMSLIVSRGAGTWGPRMRLFRQGEILLITLRK